LQREDEEAVLAALAVQAEHAVEERDVKSAVKTLEPVVGEVGYSNDSDGSYEDVEVTDEDAEKASVRRARLSQR